MKCICESEMELITIGNARVFYCDSCMIFEIEYFVCEHKNFKPILLEMSNGKFMVKKYCLDCEHTFDNPLKQGGIDLKKLHKTTNEDYHCYRSKKDHSDQKAIAELTSGRHKLSSLVCKSEYSDYLNSEDWREKRLKILDRDKKVCQICGNLAECVHHLTYAHVRNEYFFELISLCNSCHLEHYHPERIQNN
jgi:hypothetical protein